MSENRHLLNACVLATFPVLYFFSWLYYTDPGATLFTLLLYSLTLDRRYFLASLAGVAAILFRQTNVIWVFFAAGLVKFDVIESYVKRKKRKGRENLHEMGDVAAVKTVLSTTFESPLIFLLIFRDILFKVFWYLIVLFSFVLFVVLNKGIVVGDRSNHQAVLNFPQFFYFIAISSSFSFLHLVSLSKLKRFIVAVVRNPLKFCLIYAVMSVLVWKLTYEHKYTLSDNRHYTFYVWSKIYKRHALVKFALVPGYIYCLYQIYVSVLHKGLLWRVAMLVCTLAVLVPQALFEFRYYLIPFLILRLNMKVPCSKLLFLELCLYSAINIFTVYMFVNKPFLWSNESSLQRFMW